MDDLERKLVDLNNALIEMAKERFENASKRSLEPDDLEELKTIADSLKTPAQDTIIINHIDIDEDPQHSRIVSDDYRMIPSDYYIGIRSESPVLIILPKTVNENKEFIIKLETPTEAKVISGDESLIDNNEEYILSIPYSFVRVFNSHGRWFTV